MSAAVLFRIASLVAAIQGLAHGTLVLTYKPVHGAAEVAVVDAMKSNHFLFAGALRSYWGFYTGYAMMSAFTCFVEALLLWQLGRFAETNEALVRSIAAVFILFNIGHALLAAKFFFPLPAVFDLLLVLLLGASFIATGGGASSVR